MEKKAFNLLKGAESSWWYRGRSFAIQRLIGTYLKKRGINILDVGAGFGALFETLSIFGSVTAFEIDSEALKECAKKGYKALLTSEIELHSHHGRYQLIGAFDVIEHIEDDEKFAVLLRSLLSDEGLLVVTVPAYQFMWSSHDVDNHHFRRYTKKSATALLERAGFEIKYASYWNFFLFPIAVLMRRLGYDREEGLPSSRFVDTVLGTIVSLESFCVPYVSFPWGTSVFIVAKKLK